MRLLLVGASGFVGRHFPPNYFNCEVLMVDKLWRPFEGLPKTEFLKGNICDSKVQEVIASWGPTHVINLAGVQYGNGVNKVRRKSYFNENISISRALKDLVSGASTITHLTHISTDMVYGAAKVDKVTESHETVPLGPYGNSKLIAENIIKTCDVDVAILRPRLVAGFGRGGTITLLKRFFDSNLPIPIIGNGENCYQMVSVTDLWKAIALACYGQASGVFNLGSDDPIRLKVLIPEVLRVLQRKNRILFLPKRGTEFLLGMLDNVGLSPLAPEQFLIASKNCVLDTSKIKKHLAWQPRDSDLSILVNALK
jgi:dTDP-glucose 4,6-dehydratase